MRDWKLGEECTHGRLGRKCDVCARDDEIAELRVRLAKYGGERWPGLPHYHWRIKPVRVCGHQREPYLPARDV